MNNGPSPNTTLPTLAPPSTTVYNEKQATIYLFQSGIDVCFKTEYPWDIRTLSCVRNLVTSFLLLITVIFCLIKLWMIFKERKRGVEYAFCIIFVLALLESLVFSFQWGYFRRTQLHFVGLYLGENMFLTVCVFYTSLILKGQHRRHLIRTVVYPICGVCVCYFFGILIYALVDTSDDTKECLEPQWVIFSVSEFTLAQVYAIAGIFLTKKLFALSFVDLSVKKKKCFALWSMIIAFELSSFTHFGSDLVYEFRNSVSCDEKFGGPQSASYSMYFFCDRLFGTLLPIWTALIFMGPSFKSMRIRRLAKRASAQRQIQDGEEHDDDDDDDDLPIAYGVAAMQQEPLLRRTSADLDFDN